MAKVMINLNVKDITEIIAQLSQQDKTRLIKKLEEESEEDLEATNPGFLASLERSRRSGRVSGEAVKAEAGLIEEHLSRPRPSLNADNPYRMSKRGMSL